jgi:DNA transformation protein and related proteins
MPPSTSYLDYIKDLLSPFGVITIRKMFGGAGVYCDGAIFAITGDDDLWLKVDDVTRAEFEAAGLASFVVEFANGKGGAMSYYNAPDEIYDDNDALTHWTGLALGASARAKKPKKKKVRKKKSKTIKG